MGSSAAGPDRTDVPVGEAAERMARLAAALGSTEWADAARAIAARQTDAIAPAPVPAYRDLTIAGLDLIWALAGQGRWAEAEAQAGHLYAYFRTARRDAHAVALAGFDGLRAAARAQDADELRDFADLLGELVA